MHRDEVDVVKMRVDGVVRERLWGDTFHRDLSNEEDPATPRPGKARQKEEQERRL